MKKAVTVRWPDPGAIAMSGTATAIPTISKPLQVYRRARTKLRQVNAECFRDLGYSGDVTRFVVTFGVGVCLLC